MLLIGCGPSLAAQQASQRTSRADSEYDGLREQWTYESYELRSRCSYRAGFTPGQQRWCAELEAQHEYTSDLLRTAREDALDARTAEHRQREIEYAERAERAQAARNIQEATQAPFRQQSVLQSPYQQAPRHCTSMVNGNLVTTNCY